MAEEKSLAQEVSDLAHQARIASIQHRIDLSQPYPQQGEALYIPMQYVPPITHAMMDDPYTLILTSELDALRQEVAALRQEFDDCSPRLVTHTQEEIERILEPYKLNEKAL